MDNLPAHKPAAVRRAIQPYFGTEGSPVPAGAAGAPVIGAGQGAQINFESADIRDFPTAVLADTLKASYSVDPRIQGSAAVSSGAALGRQNLLATVEAVLQLRVSGGTSRRHAGSRRMESDSRNSQAGS